MVEFDDGDGGNATAVVIWAGPPDVSDEELSEAFTDQYNNG